MKIETIRLHNFGPYADETIDFKGTRACVVTGPNGAGKSTIVDAILWALWGKARAPIDNLIRLGETECEVEVTLATGGQRYTVARKRSLKGRGASSVAFDRHVGDERESLAADGVRATDEKIVATIGLSYDLATSTAFLLQGQSDTFSKATPQERRRILSMLLGLSKWDVRRDKARGLAREERQSAGERRAAVEAIRSTMDDAEAIRAQFDEKRAEEVETTRRASEASDRSEKAKSARLEADQKVIEAQGSRTRFHVVNEDIRRHATKIEAHRIESTRASADLERLSSGRPVDVVAQDVAEATERARDLRAAVDAAQTTLDGKRVEYDAQREECDRLRSLADTATAEWTDAVVGLRRVESDARNAAAMSRSALTQGQEVAALLGKALCGGKGEYAACPFIERARGVDLDALQAAYAETEKALEVARQAVEAARVEPTSVTEAKALVAAAHAELHALKVAGTEASAALTAARGPLDEAGRRVRTLEEENREASRREAEAVRLRGVVEACAKAIEAARDEIALLEDERAQLATVVDGLEALTSAALKAADEEREAGYTLQALQRSLTMVAADLSRLDAVLARAMADGERVAKQEAQAVVHSKRAATADTLETAYKDAPLLILETVLPQVEAKANDLLARVSVTGMRVTMPTQKALKSSDKIADTLDLIVEDYDGLRPYETYSGGEKFRLDWALRVALAWVLTAKAGAPLETLIVDEGFGSLDSQGVQAFASILAATAELFGLTLVVSHVPELSEAFPRTLRVEKAAGGSRAVWGD